MLRIPDMPPLSALRDFLLESGYDGEHLGKDLGLSYGLYGNFGNLQPLLERTSADELLPVLARLFFVGWPVPCKQLRRHIPDAILQLCLSSGVLAAQDDEFLPNAVVIPFETTVLLACDAPRLRRDDPNIVMGPSATTNMLARAAFRTRTKSLLDVGTGGGVLAVLSASFADRVAGTDINERAISFARFNAALNGRDNVEFFHGDAFDPVEGNQFSRILANPPFFLSATKQFIYSDSPLELDGFTAKVAKEAPNHLEENGTFQMICEWVQIKGEPWEERLRSWTANSGCDVFVLLGPQMDAMDYAERRFLEAGNLHPFRNESLMAERLNYLRDHDVELVLSGIITMRKRNGPNWFAASGADVTKETAAGIRERMDALTFVTGRNQDQWLRARLRIALDTAIVQTTGLGADGWTTTNIEVKKSGGITDQLKIDLPVLQAIEMFDGTQTLEEIIQKTAAMQNIPHDEATARCLALAKRLVQSSFVIPVNSTSASSQE